MPKQPALCHPVGSCPPEPPERCLALPPPAPSSIRTPFPLTPSLPSLPAIFLSLQLAGFSNRFDRGMAANCLQFWRPPTQEWWSEYERGDRVSGGNVDRGRGGG